MYLKSQAVTCSVAVNGQVVFCDNAAGGSIDFFNFGAGFYHFEGGGLGLLGGIVKFFIESGGSADGKTSGYVTAVALIPDAEVYEYGIVFF